MQKKPLFAALFCVVAASAHADNPLPVNKNGVTVWPEQVCNELRQAGNNFLKAAELPEDHRAAASAGTLALWRIHCRVRD
jgi:hypothetical protein